MESNLCVVETHIYLCRCVQGYGTCECTCVEARGDARGLPPALLTLFIVSHTEAHTYDETV